MKDFFKIFFLLCLLVATFLFGRNYGEENFKQTNEYQNLIRNREDSNFTKNDFENAKTKFQNILDGAETKKSEELLAQILQVFLADLGLRIQNQKAFVKTADLAAARPGNIKTEPVVVEQASFEPEPKKEKTFDYKKIKSYEWILQNSRDNEELQSNLKNVEIRNIDLYLKSAIEAKPPEMDTLFGSYRGRIKDVLNKEYGTLSFTMNPVQESNPMKLKGSIKIFKNEKETSARNFTTTQIGYQVIGSLGFIIDNGNTYYQVYKIKETQQLAGFFYERLVNGTTKTIGSFLLNRVDQF